MKPEDAYFNSFEELFEELTEIKNNEEYTKEIVKNKEAQEKLREVLGLYVEKKRSYVTCRRTNRFILCTKVYRKQSSVQVCIKEGIRIG